MTCEAHYLLITGKCRVVTCLTCARGGKVSREQNCSDPNNDPILNLEFCQGRKFVAYFPISPSEPYIN